LKGLVSLQSIESLQMKTRKTISQGFALLSVLLFSAATIPNSNGQTIVEDDLFDLFNPSFVNSSIGIDRNPNGGDGTQLLFDIAPPTLTTSRSFTVTGGFVSLDVSGGEWFLAQAGQVFSPDTIATGQFQNLSSTFIPFDVPSRQFFQNTELSDFVDSPDNVLGSDFTEATQFYIAVATTSSDDVPVGVFPGDPNFPPRDIFGWALIEVGASFFDDSFRSIELLDSAVAFDAGNIIIGQNAFAIPEPSSGIVLATLLGLGVARRRKR